MDNNSNSNLKNCRHCNQQISIEAKSCPNCGCPAPIKPNVALAGPADIAIYIGCLVIFFGGITVLAIIGNSTNNSSNYSYNRPKETSGTIIPGTSDNEARQKIDNFTHGDEKMNKVIEDASRAFYH